MLFVRTHYSDANEKLKLLLIYQLVEQNLTFLLSSNKAPEIFVFLSPSFLKNRFFDESALYVESSS
jgi:hypothetical protein